MVPPTGALRPARDPSPWRAGRVPFWIPLVLVVSLLAAGLRAMERRARSEGYGWIDPTALAFPDLPGWVDPRWERSLRAVLGEVPPFRTDDPGGPADLTAALQALPFVRDARVTQVLWPDGIAVELALREPVACIPVGRHFLPVSDDGVVLPGLWTLPPRVEGRFLPVIGPLEDANGVFAGARPGDWLAEDRHRDALAVVCSARGALSDAQAGRMGRFVVDASRGRETAPDEPGVRIELEGGRTVLFGRPAASTELGVPDAPGSLPVARKWEALGRALDLLEDDTPDAPAGGWLEVDVRWDTPEIRLAPAELLALASEERIPAERPRPVYEAPHASTPSPERGSAPVPRRGPRVR